MACCVSFISRLSYGGAACLNAFAIVIVTRCFYRRFMNGRFISGLCFGGVPDNFSAKSTLQSANNSASNSPAYVSHFRGTTALVTGDAGFVGSNIVDALLAAEAHVRVLDDLSTGDRRNLLGAQIQSNAIKNGNTSDLNIDGDQSVVAARKLILRSNVAPNLLLALSTTLPPRDADSPHSCADISSAISTLNFDPQVSMLEGLRQTWQSLV